MNNAAPFLCMLWLGIFCFHVASSQDALEDSTVVRHVYICGTANALDSDPDVRKRVTPYRSVLPMQSSTDAEIRTVPAERGAQLLNIYLDNVRDRFSIGGVESCGISKSTEDMVFVSCATTYVPGYEKVYFIFEYEHVAESHAKIVVEVKKRTSTGRVLPASQALSSEDQVWFGDLFKTILNELLDK